MALKIRCPSCGVSLSAPDSCHGKSITCPKCNSTFTALTEEEWTEYWKKERLRLETEKRKQLQEEMEKAREEEIARLQEERKKQAERKKAQETRNLVPTQNRDIAKYNMKTKLLTVPEGNPTAVAIIVAALILLGGYIGYVEYKESQIKKTVRDAFSHQESLSTSTSKRKIVSVFETSHRIEKSFGLDSITVYGKVKNTCNVDLSVVTLKVVFYDRADQIIGTSPATVLGLDVGETKTWEAIALDI
jgi:uncharacterized Zn finger protein (UPF0148 family)